MTPTDFQVNQLQAQINALRSKERTDRQCNVKRLHSGYYKAQLVERLVDWRDGRISDAELRNFINAYDTV